MKDVLNVKPVLLKQNAPQMDAFMKDVVNVKPVLLKHNAPQIDAFMKDVHIENIFHLRAGGGGRKVGVVSKCHAPKMILQKRFCAV